MLSRVVIQVSIRRASSMAALIARAHTLSRPDNTGDPIATENAFKDAPGQCP
jgi:hypothetical protein